MKTNIYNQVGSLTHLLNELKNHNIHRFDSFESINDFKNNYKLEIDEYIELKTNELTDEISESNNKLDESQKKLDELISNRKKVLSDEIELINKYFNETHIYSNLILKTYHFFLKKYYSYRQDNLTNDYERELLKPYKSHQNKINKLNESITYSTNNFNQIIDDRTKKYILEIDHILTTLEKLNSIYYGIIGELKAVKELSKLPSTYYIINDFQKTFNPPIYNKNDQDRIHSIQADHIVVGPTGIFLIETKNWSNQSVNSIDLFSPVKQLKRTGFALFCYLNDLIRYNNIDSFESHWGIKKLSINNILLMTNANTKEQFQFVKITSLNDINRYVTKHPIVLNEKQILSLVEILTE